MRRTAIMGVLMGLAASAPAWAAHDTLAVGMVQFPQDLHPYSPNSVAKLVVLRAGLRTVTVNDGLKTVCQLCTTLPTFENGGVKIVTRSDGVDTMEVTYTLRPDLFWADGEPVTATDVAFGFQIGQWLQPQRLITGVAAIDPHVFQVKIGAVRADYADLIPSPISEHVEGAIARAAHDPQTYLRRSAFTRAPETPGLWMGPYRIGESKPDTITLLPNQYWKGEPLAFKSIALKLIESTAVLQSKLNSGEIDMPMPEAGLSQPQVFALAAKPGSRFDVSFIATTNIEHLVVNLDNKALADRRVRQAIMLGIDRPAIIAKVLDGHAEIADSSLNANDFGFDPNVRKYRYDPRAARALLAEAGYKPGVAGVMTNAAGQRLSFELSSVNDNKESDQIEQLVQGQLKGIGVELVIKNEPTVILFGGSLRFRTFPGLVLTGALRGASQLPPLTTAQIPVDGNNHTGANYAGFSNAELDAAVTAATSELDLAKRAALIARIQQIEAEELPNLPLFFVMRSFVVPKWLGGVLPVQASLVATSRIEDWRAK